MIKCSSQTLRTHIRFDFYFQR